MSSYALAQHVECNYCTFRASIAATFVYSPLVVTSHIPHKKLHSALQTSLLSAGPGFAVGVVLETPTG